MFENSGALTEARDPLEFDRRRHKTRPVTPRCFPG